MRDDFSQVNGARFLERGNLVPGAKELPAIYPPDSCGFEDDVIVDIHCDFLWEYAQDGNIPSPAQRLKTRLQRRLVAGHFQEHIHALAGFLQDALCRIFRAGVNGERCAQFPSHIKPVFVRIHGVNFSCASCLAEHDGAKPNWAAAKNRHPPPRNILRKNRMNGIPKGLLGGCHLMRDGLVVVDRIVLRDCNVFRIAAVGINSQDFQVLAYVRICDPALEAVIVRDVGFT